MEDKKIETNIPISTEEKNAAAIAYVWIMSVFVYLARKRDPYVRFHATQAVALFVLSILVWFIPVVSQGLELVLGVLMIVGFLQAAQGRYFQIPVIGQLVFQPNPVRSTLKKLGQTLAYLWFWIGSRFSRNPELRQKLNNLTTELTGSNKDTAAGETVEDVKKHNDIAALGYVWMLSIVVTVMNRNSDYVQFHARQGVVLFILSCCFAIIPTIGFYLNILVLLLSIAGFLMAFSGERYSLPVIGYIAEKNQSLESFYLHCKAWIRYVAHSLRRTWEQAEQVQYEQVLSQTREAYQKKKTSPIAEQHPERDVAAASYLFLGPLVWYIHRKEPFTTFHAKQGTLLAALFFILWLIPPLRWLSLLSAAMMLLGFLVSLKSEYYYMPLVYDLLTSQVKWQDVGLFFLRMGKQALVVLKRVFISDKTDSSPVSTEIK